MNRTDILCMDLTLDLYAVPLIIVPFFHLFARVRGKWIQSEGVYFLVYCL